LGLALRAMLPGALWQPERPGGPGDAVERVLILTERLPSLLERERVFKRSPKRRLAYEAVESLGGSAPLRHLTTQLKFSAAVLDGLVQQGIARVDRVAQPRDPFADLATPPPPTLSPDQRRVVDDIAATPPDVPVLIHGVTGSRREDAGLSPRSCAAWWSRDRGRDPARSRKSP
jgi:primosomal protein N'